VRPGDAVRLGAEAGVAMSGQGMRGVFHRLPEGSAAIPAPASEGPHVEVSVEVDDADRPLLGDIAEVMAKRGLVSASQHDGDCSLSEECRNDLAKRLLRIFERAGGADIAEIE